MPTTPGERQSRPCELFKGGSDDLTHMYKNVLQRAVSESAAVLEEHKAALLRRLSQSMPKYKYTTPHDHHVAQLSALLYPSILQDRAMRSELVREVLTALGFRSPFDVEHVVSGRLNDVYTSKLQHTRMFAQYTECVCLFFRKAKTPTVWDSMSVAHALRMVLGSCGLGLAHAQRWSSGGASMVA